MIIAHVKFISADVEKFSLKEPIVINLRFDDGDPRHMRITVPLQDAEGEARKIISHVRNFVKELNTDSRAIYDNALDSFVNIVIADPDRVEERLKGFLSKIIEKKKYVQNSQMHTGYLDVINQIKGIRTDF